jgi:hypothetical protein
MLKPFRALLKPGGALVIVGLYRLDTFTDYAIAAAVLPGHRFQRHLLYRYSVVYRASAG